MMEKFPETPDDIGQSRRVSETGETMKLEHNDQDIGAALFQEVQEYSPEELEAESAKVRRLIDWHIMPIVSPLTSDRREHILTTVRSV